MNEIQQITELLINYIELIRLEMKYNICVEENPKDETLKKLKNELTTMRSTTEDVFVTAAQEYRQKLLTDFEPVPVDREEQLKAKIREYFTEERVYFQKRKILESELHEIEDQKAIERATGVKDDKN